MLAAISRITLGTAQFGQAYGVANRSGIPTDIEVRAILEVAAEGGVTCLDTARAYGESERALGRALIETGLHSHFIVVTKISHAIPAGLSSRKTAEAVRKSVEESLSHLRCEQLPYVMLHRDANPVHFDALLACREAGLVSQCGVSFTCPINAQKFVNHSLLAAVQLPVNPLDHRFDAIKDVLHMRGVRIFARGCYLQGLLLMSDAATPQHLQAIKPARDFLRSLAKRCSMPLADLLLRAALDRHDIDSVVVGMENLLQLRENIRVFRTPSLPRDILDQIWSFRPTIPGWLVDPSRWLANQN